MSQRKIKTRRRDSEQTGRDGRTGKPTSTYGLCGNINRLHDVRKALKWLHVGR